MCGLVEREGRRAVGAASMLTLKLSNSFDLTLDCLSAAGSSDTSARQEERWVGQTWSWAGAVVSGSS